MCKFVPVGIFSYTEVGHLQWAVRVSAIMSFCCYIVHAVTWRSINYVVVACCCLLLFSHVVHLNMILYRF
jgi:hypothetical protein